MTRPRSRRIVAVWIAAASLLGAGAVIADANEDAARCAQLKTAVTLDQMSVAGRRIKVSGTWTAAPGSPGVFLQLKTDGDVWGSYQETGAKGAWSWEGDEPIESRMCGRHVMIVFAHPVLQRGKEIVNCFATSANEKRVYDIDCSNHAAIDTCVWTCTPDTDGGADCDGKCTGSATGLATTFLPFWKVNGVPLPDPETATPGPWQQDLHCKKGEPVSFLVWGVAGSGAHAAPVSIPCGENRQKP